MLVSLNNIDIQVALIAAGVSVATFIVGKIIEWLFLHYRLQVQNREIYSKYVEFSLQQKIKSYQTLLRIIRYVGLGSHYAHGYKQEFTQEEKTENIRQTLRALIEWQQNEHGYFLLSAESHEWLLRLEKRLKTQPEYNEQGYSSTQLQNITGAVAGLKNSLFKDMYIYRMAEDSFVTREQISQLLKKERQEVKYNRSSIWWKQIYSKLTK